MSLAVLRDLIDHKGHANAALLTSIVGTAAASDREILTLLEHVLLANRFWLHAVLREPFDVAEESRPTRSFDALVQRYVSTHASEVAWLAAAGEADLALRLVDARIPGGTCAVADALLQVCLHSHGHRAQLAKLLRRHGIVPPVTDFILWLVERPAPVWPIVSTP